MNYFCVETVVEAVGFVQKCGKKSLKKSVENPVWKALWKSSTFFPDSFKVIHRLNFRKKFCAKKLTAGLSTINPQYFHRLLWIDLFL